MHIAGVIILYYPQIDVMDNIKSYLCDLDILYVIDNSEQCNRQVVEQLKKYPNICYTALGTNCGIAYALNLALKKANTYDYLLTMDQDSRFFEGEFRKYKKEVLQNSRPDIAVYSVNYISNIKEYGRQCQDIFIEKTITSGAIINVKIANKVGGFNTALFIDGVDHEYCYKIRNQGYKILKLGRIFMEHHIGTSVVHRFLWRTLTPSNHNAVRRYYMTRNNIYLYFNCHYHQNWDQLIDSLVKAPIKILLYEAEKKENSGQSLLVY